MSGIENDEKEVESNIIFDKKRKITYARMIIELKKAALFIKLEF